MALVVVVAHLPWVETELLLLLEMVVLEPHLLFQVLVSLMLVAAGVQLIKAELLALAVPVAVEMEQRVTQQAEAELLIPEEEEAEAVSNRLEQTAAQAALAS
jgi:hypothetical protein